MAGMAKDQRFPSAGGHDLYPSRLLPTCVLLQVFECSDVVHLDAIGHAGGPTVFAHLGKEPLLEF
jgi:hypothetical protein